MPDQLQLRGGTTTEHNSFTGASKEVTVDTTKKTLVVHDGATQGGIPLMRESGSNAATTVGIGTGGTNAINIDNNQNVGIGIASPTSKLHVANSSGDAFIRVVGGTNFGVSYRRSSDNAQIGFTGNGGAVNLGAANLGLSASRANGNIVFQTGGTAATNERMRITSDGLLGLGTTTPSGRLDIQGVSNENQIFIRSSQGGAPLLIWNGQGVTDSNDDSRLGIGRNDVAMIYTTANASPVSALAIGNTDAVPIVFSTSNTQRMRITSSGQLLLGVNSAHPINNNNPNFLVSGTNFATSLISQQRFENTAAGATLALAHSRNGTRNTHTIVQNGDELGKIRFYGSDGNDFNNYGAEVSAIVNGTPGSDDMPGALLFKTTADGAPSSAERMRIQSDGKIGIGLTDPDQKLEVNGIIKGSSYFQGGASATSGNNFHFGAEGDGTFRIYEGNYGAGTERMRILSSGGITFNGDTAAANALDDYEEGTWTPQIGGVYDETYTTQAGTYVKIGDQFTAWFNIEFNQATTGGSNRFNITSPFTMLTGNNHVASGVLAFHDLNSPSSTNTFAAYQESSTGVTFYAGSTLINAPNGTTQHGKKMIGFFTGRTA